VRSGWTSSTSTINADVDEVERCLYNFPLYNSKLIEAKGTKFGIRHELEAHCC